MKLLITGGLGFIGSNFILKVLSENHDFSIINVDAELYGSNHHNLDPIKNQDNYKFVKGNITNRHLMDINQVSIVFPMLFAVFLYNLQKYQLIHIS